MSEREPLTYDGKLIDDMSREELIEAAKTMRRMLDEKLTAGLAPVNLEELMKGSLIEGLQKRQIMMAKIFGAPPHVVSDDSV